MKTSPFQTPNDLCVTLKIINTIIELLDIYIKIIKTYTKINFPKIFYQIFTTCDIIFTVEPIVRKI